MKYWEIIADNLSKAGWSWAVYRRLIPTGARSGLLTRIADDLSDVKNIIDTLGW
jgi:hypothetical protein